MTQAEWLDCCALISALWPHRPLDPAAAQAWYPMLADLPGPRVESAVRAIALEADSTWPPSLGQLRVAAEPADRPWEGAFADLRRLVARHGSYAPRPDPDEVADEALSAVIDAYGWRASCMLEPADPTVRAQWRDAYRAAQRRVREQHRRDVATHAVGAGTTRQLEA